MARMPNYEKLRNRASWEVNVTDIEKRFRQARIDEADVLAELSDLPEAPAAAVFREAIG